MNIIQPVTPRTTTCRHKRPPTKHCGVCDGAETPPRPRYDAIQTAMQSGAILTAQFATSTGFALHMSWPLLISIPFVQAKHESLEEAFALLETEVRDHLIAEEEAGEAFE